MVQEALILRGNFFGALFLSVGVHEGGSCTPLTLYIIPENFQNQALSLHFRGCGSLLPCVMCLRSAFDLSYCNSCPYWTIDESVRKFPSSFPSYQTGGSCMYGKKHVFIKELRLVQSFDAGTIGCFDRMWRRQ